MHTHKYKSTCVYILSSCICLVFGHIYEEKETFLISYTHQKCNHYTANAHSTERVNKWLTQAVKLHLLSFPQALASRVKKPFGFLQRSSLFCRWRLSPALDNLRLRRHGRASLRLARSGGQRERERWYSCLKKFLRVLGDFLLRRGSVAEIATVGFHAATSDTSGLSVSNVITADTILWIWKRLKHHKLRGLIREDLFTVKEY